MAVSDPVCSTSSHALPKASIRYASDLASIQSRVTFSQPPDRTKLLISKANTRPFSLEIISPQSPRSRPGTPVLRGPRLARSIAPRSAQASHASPTPASNSGSSRTTSPPPTAASRTWMWRRKARNTRASTSWSRQARRCWRRPMRCRIRPSGCSRKESNGTVSVSDSGGASASPEFLSWERPG